MHCRACDRLLEEQEIKDRKVLLPTGDVILVDACMCNRCWDTEKHDTVHEYRLGDNRPSGWYNTGE